MQNEVSDYDLNCGQKPNSFSIERNDQDWGTVLIEDFFSFLCEENKGWLTNGEAIVIPTDGCECLVYSFDQYCKEYSVKLRPTFSRYANSGFLTDWDSSEDELELLDTAAEEAYEDFRRDCGYYSPA